MLKGRIKFIVRITSPLLADFTNFIHDDIAIVTYIVVLENILKCVPI